MSDRIRKTETYRGNFQSYTEAFKVYEEGKHRRYSLLFSVNGGAVATAKLFPDPLMRQFLGSLKIWQVAIGMIVFTLLMWWDLWIFAQRMRTDVGDDSGPATEGVFSRTGKIVLSVICSLILLGWLGVIPGSTHSP